MKKKNIIGESWKEKKLLEMNGMIAHGELEDSRGNHSMAIKKYKEALRILRELPFYSQTSKFLNQIEVKMELSKRQQNLRENQGYIKVNGEEKSEYISLKNYYGSKKSRDSKPLKELHNNYRPITFEEAKALYELGQISDSDINFDVDDYEVCELYFKSTQIKKLPEILGNLTSLRCLTISSPQLEELPDSIGNLTKLTQLSVYSEHSLVKIPETVGNLTLLEELNLKKNKLKSLPDSIGGLISLKTLFLNDNELEILPQSIGMLKSLKKLDLHKNQLSTLPMSIGGLELINELYLHNNKLQKLPNSIGNLSLLEVLQIDHNKLKMIPESVGNLTQLKNLYLRFNELIELPSSIGNLELIPTLDVMNNKLSTIPNTIENMRNLSSISLSNNNLTSLPDTIGNVRYLNSINLDNNQLTSLPNSIGNLRFLNYMTIQNNNLIANPNIIGHVEIVYLDGNKQLEKEYPKTQQIEHSEIIAIQSLENLLGRKLWYGLEDDLFQYFRIENGHVRSLILTYPSISQIPDSIKPFKYLETLNLRGHKISEISSFLLEFEHLQYINLLDNPISNIPKTIMNNIQFVTYNRESDLTIVLKNNHNGQFKIVLSSNAGLEKLLINYYKDSYSSETQLYTVLSKLSRILTHEEFLEYVSNLDTFELKRYFTSEEKEPLMIYLEGLLAYLDNTGVVRSFKMEIYDTIKALGPHIILYLLNLLIDQENYLRISVLEALVHIDEFNKDNIKNRLFSTPHKLKIPYIFHLPPYLNALLEFFNPNEFFSYIDKFHAQHLKSTFRCETTKAQTIIAEIIMRESIDGQIIEKLAVEITEAIIEISNLDFQMIMTSFLPEEVVDLLRKLNKIVTPAPLNDKISDLIDHIQSVEEEWRDY